jgi:hypothetical protein
MFDTSSQSFQRQDDQEVHAISCLSHTPTTYIHSQISVHRKHEIIEQSGI